MKKIRIYTIILFSIFFPINIYAQTINWDRVMHIGGNGDDSGSLLFCDNNQNIIIVGHYNNVAQFDTIFLNSISIYGGAFVTKMDSLGNFLWAKRMVGTNTQYFHSVATDILDNIYVVGSFTETIYLDSLSFTGNGSADFVIAKYNSEGVLQWAKSAGGIDLDGGMSIICSDSLLFVGGEYRDSVYFDTTLLISNSNGYSDIFLACLDLDGNYQWIKTAGGIEWDVSRGITIDEESNIFLTGIYMNTAYFGDTSITSNGSSNAFIAKYDKNGQLKWVRSMGGSGDAWGRSVIISNNEIYVKGHFDGTAQFGPFSLNCQYDSDYFICKLDMNGNFLWAKSIETRLYFMDDFWNHSLESDEFGNIYITGWFMDSLVYDNLTVQSNGSYDIFVIKIDGDGNLIWCLTAGNNHSYGDYSRSIARDGNGNLYITGRFYSTLFFGDSSVSSYGSADVFVAKIHEEPLTVEYDKQSLTVNIFPNPASNVLNIFSNNNSIQEVEIINSKGECISKYNYPNLNYIDVSKFSRGIYFVRIFFTNMSFTKKIIII